MSALDPDVTSFPLADDYTDPMVNDLIEAAQNWQARLGNERNRWEKETDRLRAALTARLHAAAPAPPDDVRERIQAVVEDHVTNWVTPKYVHNRVIGYLMRDLLAALADARPGEGSE